MEMRYLSQINTEIIKNKTCLLRVNLDIKDPNRESLRIEAVMPTVKYLLKNNVKIIILSHRGRPNGIDSSLSLKPLVDMLSKKVGQQLEWLENLRFDKREQENSDEFAKELAGKGDFFVNDDFATSHRSCASLVAITKFLPSYGGLLLESEVENLSKIIQNPKKPLIVIIGGSKIDDKINLIDNLKNKTDYFLMGSAYLKLPRTKDQGPSNDPASPSLGGQLPNNVLFPVDNNQGFDIGDKTIEQYSQIIKTAETIVWNGPLGKFEESSYANGSIQIAKAIIAANHNGAFSIVGGGDTEQFLSANNLKDDIGFISTGGGAMLEFLSGKKLPALEALKNQ